MQGSFCQLRYTALASERRQLSASPECKQLQYRINLGIKKILLDRPIRKQICKRDRSSSRFGIHSCHREFDAPEFRQFVNLLVHHLSSSFHDQFATPGRAICTSNSAHSQSWRRFDPQQAQTKFHNHELRRLFDISLQPHLLPLNAVCQTQIWLQNTPSERLVLPT